MSAQDQFDKFMEVCSKIEFADSKYYEFPAYKLIIGVSKEHERAFRKFMDKTLAKAEEKFGEIYILGFPYEYSKE